jgi:hypothetical protein
MKLFVQSLFVAVALSAPIIAFSQSTAQTVPGKDQVTQARVADQPVDSKMDVAGYGPGSRGSSQSGRPVDTTVSSYSPPVYIAQ